MTKEEYSSMLKFKKKDQNIQAGNNNFNWANTVGTREAGQVAFSSLSILQAWTLRLKDEQLDAVYILGS